MKTDQTSRAGRASSWTRHFRSGEKGQVIIITAFAIVVMFAIVGLAVDVGRMYAARAELGRAVDAAALAGVIEFPDATAASNRATAYLTENEPTADPNIVPDGGNNTLTVDASKTVNMFFIRVLGINTATVSAHAKAGFGVAYLDAVLVLDVTASMVGDPITNAKQAAIDFKDTLLGSSPNGRTVIGVTPFRGCFRPSPMSNSLTSCVPSSQQSNLSYNSSTLTTLINSMTAGGGSAGTNVCTGMAAGWNILNGAGNHTSEENSRRYMILLSDGDNYYPGNYTYQAPLGVSSTSSPTGTTIAGTDYPCQPHNSCTSPWNTSPATPCTTGTYGDLIASDDFDSGDWDDGTGWSTSAWTTSGDNSNATTGTPQTTPNHARMRQTGAIYRKADLSSYTAATLTFWRKGAGWESADRGYVDVTNDSTCSSGWTTIQTYSTSTSNWSSYREVSVDISAYANNANFCVRFRMAGSDTTDILYIDDVQITSGAGGSTNGYLNGNDGSNPSTCNESPRPRERQLDVRTLDIARAIKAQNVEIFVVAFTAPTIPGCNLGSGTIWNDEDSAECNTVTGPNSSPTGPIGDNTSDTSANVRLLKCIASSDDETDDHYFYADTADDLPAIFTQIAQQIAHRLIE